MKRAKDTFKYGVDLGITHCKLYINYSLLLFKDGEYNPAINYLNQAVRIRNCNDADTALQMVKNVKNKSKW